jgi:Tfp pilus assembly protein PilP
MKIIKIFLVILICIGFTFLSAQQTANTGNKSQKTQKKEPDKTESDLMESNVPLDPLPVGTTEELEPSTGDFIYKPKGRRDPFWNLLQGKSVKIKREEKEGIAGLLIEEMELEGILLKEGRYIALFKGPDGKPYDVRVGDNVYDGEVIKIDNNTVVFKRLLTIALGGTKEKITVITLIPEEEAAKQ